MDAWMIACIVGVSLLVGSVVAWVVIRQERSESLRRRSGAEYGRASRTSGGRGLSETRPPSAGKRTQRFDIQPLLARFHNRFADRWPSAGASFLDNLHGEPLPAGTLGQDTMQTRGYPASETDQRTADIPVDYRRSVDNDGETREAALAIQRGLEQTDALRPARNPYRSRFEELLETNTQLKER